MHSSVIAIENVKLFLSAHAAVERLLSALIYARNVLAECEFAEPGQEKAKHNRHYIRRSVDHGTAITRSMIQRADGGLRFAFHVAPS